MTALVLLAAWFVASSGLAFLLASVIRHREEHG